MCTDFIDTMCTAIKRDCPCNGCQDELEAYYDCYITDVSDGSCFYLDCEAYVSTDPPVPITQPTMPPVVPPGSPSPPPIAPTPTSPTDPQPVGTTTATVAEPTNSGSSNSIGPIIGGVVGGIAVICATLLGLFYMKNQRGRSESAGMPGKAPAEIDGQDFAPPRMNEASTLENSVSTYATPMSQPSSPQNHIPRSPPANPDRLHRSAGQNQARVARYPSPEPQEYMPNFKDQVRTVVPTVEATPLDEWNNSNSSNRTPNRPRTGVDP